MEHGILEDMKHPLRFIEEFHQRYSEELFQTFYHRFFRSQTRTFSIKSLANQLDITRAEAQDIIAFGEKHGVISKYHAYWQIPRKLIPPFYRAMRYIEAKAYEEANSQNRDQEEKKREERSDDYPADDETEEEYENRLRESLREDIEEDA